MTHIHLNVRCGGNIHIHSGEGLDIKNFIGKSTAFVSYKLPRCRLSAPSISNAKVAPSAVMVFLAYSVETVLSSFSSKLARATAPVLRPSVEEGEGNQNGTLAVNQIGINSNGRQRESPKMSIPVSTTSPHLYREPVEVVLQYIIFFLPLR